MPAAESIELTDVTLRRGAHCVVAGLHATFRAGSVTALTGPNGSGKSTVLDAIAGLVAWSGGRVAGLPADVAYVPQSVPPTALPLAVRDAVAMGRWAARPWWRPSTRRDRSVVEAQLERLAVADLAHRSFDELSGGQRQRALVAVGLAQEAPVLLVDEPTAGVDAASAVLVLTALAAEARAGVVVVHAAHDPVAVAAADAVVALGQPSASPACS